MSPTLIIGNVEITYVDVTSNMVHMVLHIPARAKYIPPDALYQWENNQVVAAFDYVKKEFIPTQALTEQWDISCGKVLYK